MSDNPLATLEGFMSATAERRAAATKLILSGLGGEFTSAEPVGTAAFLAFRHRATGLTLAAIPGGAFDMGMSDEALEDASEYVDFGYSTAEWVKQYQPMALPVHRVTVKPFLIATEVVLNERLARLVPGETFDDLDSECSRENAVQAVLAAPPLRLVCEAEFEWVASEGGSQFFTNNGAKPYCESDDYPSENEWGIKYLHGPQWMADGFHKHYTGAPQDGGPWRGDDPLPGVIRGKLRPWGPEDDRQNLLYTLASYRCPFKPAKGQRSHACVRLACDLPAVAQQ
jgi:hypothetical protein